MNIIALSEIFLYTCYYHKEHGILIQTFTPIGSISWSDRNHSMQMLRNVSPYCPYSGASGYMQPPKTPVPIRTVCQLCDTDTTNIMSSTFGSNPDCKGISRTSRKWNHYVVPFKIICLKIFKTAFTYIAAKLSLSAAFESNTHIQCLSTIVFTYLPVDCY